MVNGINCLFKTVNHCMDRSDEDIDFCNVRNCPSDYFMCNNRRCIPQNQTCKSTSDNMHNKLV